MPKHTQHSTVNKALLVTEATRLPPVGQAPACSKMLGHSLHLSMPRFPSHLPNGFTDFSFPLAQVVLRSPAFQGSSTLDSHVASLLLYAAVTTFVSSGFSYSSSSVQLAYLVNKFIAM